MATPTKKHRAALDPQFVLFLESGAAGCQSIFTGFENLGFEFILTDTALQEIQDLAEQGSRPEFVELAKRTLPRLRTHYGIKTIGLKSIENGFAEIIANFLLEKCLVDHATKNEALLIAEASLHECDFLVMLENPLTNLDSQKLNLVLVEKGGNPISIISTEVVLQMFGTVLKENP